MKTLLVVNPATLPAVAGDDELFLRELSMLLREI